MKMMIARSLLYRALAVALLGLLLTLASLQYRWLSEMSEAEHQRSRSSLERSARLFARDFDRELTRTFLYSFSLIVFPARSDEGLSVGGRYALFHEAWAKIAPYPELVRDLFQAELNRSSGYDLSRFDKASGELRNEAWPAELSGLEKRFLEHPLPEGFAPPDRQWQLFDSQIPALVIPSGLSGRPRGRRGRPPGRPPPEDLSSEERRLRSERVRENRQGEGRRGPGRSARDFARGLARSYLVVHLDPDPLLRDLAERYFGGEDGLAYHVRVVDALRPEQVRFKAGPEVAQNDSGALTEDAAAELFRFLPSREARQLFADSPPVERMRREPWDLGRLMGLFASIGLEGGWRLIVTHPSGSLVEAVDVARRRNLAISLGILLVLGASALLLVLTTQRAQAMARRQLEFVAGVTHELRTPLTAMRSAGANLADGVIQDEARVRRYGLLIEREGRRLSEMVEQVLEFAGIRSGKRVYRPEPTPVRELVEEALAENRSLLDEEGFAVEEAVADDAVLVNADRAALRRALGNLIGNALKYAANGAWIRIGARKAGREVRIDVEDRGPGIAPEDRPHLFEPFYRGRDLSAGRIPGSGLGLALVKHICEAHGGRVSVSSQARQGSIFSMHLPAAAATPHRLEGENS